MPPNSPVAQVVARRFIASPSASLARVGDSRDTADHVAAAERIFRALSGELSRWFGPFGYHALLTRALVKSRGEHRVLADVHVRSATEPWLAGLPEAAQLHGAEAATEGVATLLAALIDLLGRLIGEDLAVNLVSQALTSRAPEGDPGAEPDAGNLTARGGAA